MAPKTTENAKRTDRGTGGSATASGMNFQAIVTAIAGVHLIKGSPLGWLDSLVDDTPVAVWAETGGAGDDIKLELRDNFTVEVQVKRGLRTGERLWGSLMRLARAIAADEVNYGMLIVSPDSSNTIAYELSQDMRRLADGRIDNLGRLASTFSSKLEEDGLQPQSICKMLRVQVVHALDSDMASISTAKYLLSSLISNQEDVNTAWNRLYREANAIMERMGRWEASAILRMFTAEGIEIADSQSPGAVLARLNSWVIDTNQNFSLLGVREQLSINNAWLPLKILARDFSPEPESEAAEAMARYHAIGKNHRANADAKISDAEWIGRFYPHAVLIGGPGSGKSTLLTKTAQLYAKDGFPVLKVKLKFLAARMASGQTFVDSIFHLGLDGSDVLPDEAMKAGFRDWILLCDGLDECHDLQETVAKGLQQFAAGHPQARIIVTTRPIGYSATEIEDWRHYELLSPESTSGSEHLASLIRAVLPTTHKFHRNALEIVTAELEKCAVSEVVSRNPLLLGMAASLLASGGTLGASKAELYQNLFSLIAQRPNSRLINQQTSKPTLERMLDILGWALVVSPLDSERAILEHCADHLEVELGVPRLKALEVATECLNHWEDVGFMEKVHHGSEALLTFVHKTFAEFAAARYLRDLKPQETQRAETMNRLGDVAWEEVLNFASAIGSAEFIVSELTTEGDKEIIKRLEQALSILVDPAASVSSDLRKQIVKLAFDHVDSNETDDVFSLGLALAEAAKVYPDLLGQFTVSRLQSPRFTTRLIAWTCAVEAGEEYYDLDAVPSVIRSLATEISKSLKPPLLSEPVLSRELLLQPHKDRELLQRLAMNFIRRILNVWPSEKAGRHVEEILNSEQLDTIGFQNDLAELCQSRGLKTEFQTRMESTAAKLMKAFQPNSEYHRAVCAALRAVFSSLALTEGATGDFDFEQSHPLQLSAFLEIIDFEKMDISDMWAWTKPYDSKMVSEVLRALVKISVVDESVLAVEANAMLSRMDELPETSSYHVLLPTTSVDVPPPNWSDAKTLQIDQSKLEHALGHESIWLVLAATNLLSGLGKMTAKKAEELLAKGHGYGLAAAAHLTLELEPKVATELLLNRIEGPDTPYKHHLIRQLNQLNPPWNKRLETVIRKELMNSAVELTEETATLLLKYAEKDVPVLPELLNEAFQHWINIEKPYPQNGGAIPDSPRKILLEVMLELGIIDDERIMNLCHDTRGDVRKVATDALLERIAISYIARASFVNEIVNKAFPPYLLSQALVIKVPFSKTEVGQLCILLEDEDAKWRLASCKLLDPIYLESEVIRRTAEKLSADPHPEVSQAVAFLGDF